ncbi:MAG: aminotransferase class V-fold PLP-dependent enzyme [Labilithrix sp.]|nr:aminotransferase class V-fold PLP-dependent enzyme [Labilithrix sp.]MCW5811035.1 aminotransferase class V-fold PLP-dependent enzyme [Labilithrix sp.]
MLRGYDPEAFRREAHAVVDLLADHLARLGTTDGEAVVPWKEPSAQVAAWQSDFEGGADAQALFARVVAESTHLHHPGFVGHQVTAPLPLAALASFVSGFLNNGAAVYEMGPVSSGMERVLARFLTARLGYGPGADAVFTSGGSAGNLTALLAARERTAARLGGDRFTGAVLACEEAHYSTARAVRVMGWGDDGVVTVPADERFKLRADALADAFARAEAAGRTVVAVVASACSTSTGAFDPLHAVADFCAERGVWMHVDGAHGASFVLSPKHRALVDGIARADSVVWDAHKMMLCPALVTAVLFKDGRDSFTAFQGTKAAYLLDAQAAATDSAVRTLECTKGMLVLGLYAALAVHGEDTIARYLDDVVDRARDFAALLRRTPGFEVAIEPECNIVCFRYGEGDDAQERIRRAVLEDGRFYVVKTRLRGRTFLRTTIINPRTSSADLDRLVATIRDLAG